MEEPCLAFEEKENDDGELARQLVYLSSGQASIAEDDNVKQSVGGWAVHRLTLSRTPVPTRGAHTSTQPKQSLLAAHPATMRLNIAPLLIFAVVATLLPNPAHGQFFNAIRNIFRPVTNAFQRPGGLFGGGNFEDDGTARPQATGNEELFPSDCGRNVDSGTGKLCFPDGLLCRDRE